MALRPSISSKMKKRLFLGALSALIFAVLVGLGPKALFRDPESQVSGAGGRAAKTLSQVRTETGTNTPRQTATAAAPAELSSVSNKLFATAELSWDQPIVEEPFARFHDWAAQYVHAQGANKLDLEAEGLWLVRARRKALAQLIESNPERALELSVPLRVRQALPDSVAGQLEERISGAGRLAVL